MSGFLQRLAAGAINPARSIHPVVGSVFSPADKSTGAGRGLESSSTQVIATGPTAPASTAAAGLVMSLSSKMPLAENFAGTAAPVQSEPAPVLDAVRVSTPREAADASLHPSEHRLTQTPALQSRDLGAARQPPLLLPRGPADAVDARRQAAERRTALPVAASRPPARSAARPDAQREPDEIQIHIGRIEVTAMPPPVAPRAVKAQRRGLSLDEYLKRGEHSTR
jgi:hypothetical protein